MNRVLIISPDSKLIGDLRQNLSRAPELGRPTIQRNYVTLGQLLPKLRQRRPSAVIVGLSDPERALALIQDLHRNLPEIVVAAAHTSNSSELILGAVRAGASEYLGPPYEVERLEEAIRQAADTARAQARGRLIAFLPARGGSGASIIAMHVADAMSRQSAHKILLVDFDFHSGAVDFRLGLKPAFTLTDALRRSENLDELWPQLTCSWKNVDVLAPPRNFASQHDDLGRTAEVFFSARRAYEWVVSDLPVALYTSCRAALAQAETVYVVCTPELVSLHQARRKGQELRDLGVPPEAVRLLVNRMGAKHCLSAEEIGKIVGLPVTWTIPNDYDTISEASLKGGVVPANSELGLRYSALARDIMGLSAPAERPSRSLSWKNLGWSRLVSRFSRETAKVPQPLAAALEANSGAL